MGVLRRWLARVAVVCAYVAIGPMGERESGVALVGFHVSKRIADCIDDKLRFILAVLKQNFDSMHGSVTGFLGKPSCHSLKAVGMAQ